MKNIEKETAKKIEMKTLFLITSILFSTISTVVAQVSVEDVNINELDIDYCQLVGYNKSVFGKNVIVTVDYGQEFKPFKSQLIKGPDGKTIEFNSIIGALNFMEKNGWKYINNYAVTVSNSTVYHYLLKRKE